MAYAVDTHKFEEMVQVEYVTQREGEVNILWGMIKYPKVIYQKKLTYSGLCKVCGEKEFTPWHGYHSLADFDEPIKEEKE